MDPTFNDPVSEPESFVCKSDCEEIYNFSN